MLFRSFSESFKSITNKFLRLITFYNSQVNNKEAYLVFKSINKAEKQKQLASKGILSYSFFDNQFHPYSINEIIKQISPNNINLIKEKKNAKLLSKNLFNIPSKFINKKDTKYFKNLNFFYKK